MMPFVSERDFVAQYLFPKLKEAAIKLGFANVLDFAIDKGIQGLTMDLAVSRVGVPVLVIEAKFKKRSGKVEVDIEPRDPEVIMQVLQYAGLGGYPYYMACNAKRLILFQHKANVGAFESEIAAFDYAQHADWAERVLKIVLGLEKAEPKLLDDTLVSLLFEAYSDLYPQFIESLKTKMQDQGFSDKFVDWVKRQALELSDDTILKVASQATYMELNKFLFYHVIRLIYPERLEPLKIELHEDVAGALQKFYKAVQDIDYAPIYEQTLISEIPITARAEERIRTLLDTLNGFDFGRMESDFIGRIYEKLIPPAERKRLGQFYTPPAIVEFITRLTVWEESDVVLDPGCGSGGFLVGAYHRLRELKGFKSKSQGLLAYTYHQKLLDQIFGVDINQFPAHLSVINLAVQNPRARIKQINVLVEDFFNIKPGISTLSGFESFTAEGKKEKVSLPAFFDVVLGNPPYIRQELVSEDEKDRIRKLIEAEYKNKVLIGSKKKGSVTLDRTSDIFVYFVVHGLKMLREGGRLGFITSNKWLEVGFGEPFQQFLLENSKILYVIEFDRAIFVDAQVNTSIIVLEKSGNKQSRGSNYVKFIRLKKRMDPELQIQRVQDIKTNFENDSIVINNIKQKDLKPGKWSISLRAPSVYGKIIEKKNICSFSKVTDVIRAPTTGNNEYFIINKKKVDEWGIEKDYLEPCLASPKDIKKMVVENVKDYMLFVNKNKSDLKNTNVLRYIEYGEKLDVEVKRGSNRGKRRLPEVETLKMRRPFWYSLPKHESPPILFPRLIDEKPVFLKNVIKAHTPHVFYYIYPQNRNNEDVLLAFLNSSLTAFLIELYGRSYGGGVLELSISEMKSLPIINPDSISKMERDELEKDYKFLIESNEEDSENYQKQLDKRIFDILSLSDLERRQIEIGLKNLQAIRRLRTEA